ncbi:protein-L-isoaspartate(D-aspartate) O-methyltransferase [Acuticoccus sp. MNP-M23]|uniref:protein-L-isoaspartate(D-aspartate) O-methyltransferase n=1 Tax=Acuticoccus sp. MNP-M23 TaxID=3072793 RepID=UPI002814BDF9|nr:protein-L-isoaspartate(D-aspartate) O-methyltransferase [Acuticoccus sp. MNP-M23]WMS42412.1 protein-L-isoaspartate(D-aspartate) O-methyltransferase [Acuticoccus sp. MNP-M23]
MEDNAEQVARAELAMHLRRQNVAGRAVLAALESVPRSLFLDARHKTLAYADRAAPIECGQTISQPSVVAMMTEALGLTPEMRVLEIGTGSGYQTAILARLAAEVVSVERYRFLSDLAADRFRVLKIANVALVVGDGHEGWPDGAPYDRIIVTAAVEAVPAPLVEQLGEGGIIVVPVGPRDGPQELLKCTLADGLLEGERLADVRFVPLLPGTSPRL